MNQLDRLINVANLAGEVLDAGRIYPDRATTRPAVTPARQPAPLNKARMSDPPRATRTTLKKSFTDVTELLPNPKGKTVFQIGREAMQIESDYNLTGFNLQRFRTHVGYLTSDMKKSLTTQQGLALKAGLEDYTNPAYETMPYADMLELAANRSVTPAPLPPQTHEDTRYINGKADLRMNDLTGHQQAALRAGLPIDYPNLESMSFEEMKAAAYQIQLRNIVNPQRAKIGLGPHPDTDPRFIC